MHPSFLYCQNSSLLLSDDGLRDMSSDDENPTAETKELVLTSTQLSNSAVEGNVAALAGQSFP